MLINLPPPSNFSVSQHNVLQIPPEVLHLCAKCPLNLKIYIFFLTLKVIALSLNCGAYYLSFDDIQPYIGSMVEQIGSIW